MSEPNQPLSHRRSGIISRLEKEVERFESAWRRGSSPAIEDHLPAQGEHRAAILVELIHADLEFRLKSGEEVRVEAYLERFPELAVSQVVVLDLIAVEYAFRRQREANLSPEIYRQRFPDFADAVVARLAKTLSWSGPAETVTDEAGPRRLAAPPSDLPAITGHEILSVLGRGGMGVVYKARHLKLDRLVAVKMILAGPHAGAEQVERFLVEARAVARLQHPNIVQIHEVGEHEGRPFFSLEFVEGGSLDRKLQGAPQPARAAAALVETLARAMHSAHEKGIVHRDLKPANVLLAADGTPKVSDFGLAKQLDDDSGQTRTGAVMGTPSYMAPEQAAGRTKDIGPATDVYTLGAILYEMLTGRPPFRGATALETIVQVKHDEPVSPRRLVRGVPRDLETICLKCLSKEASKRYISAAELADDLQRFLDGMPVRARPVGVPARAWGWTKRQPARAAAYALFALVMVFGVGGGGATWLWQDAEVARRDADDKRREAEQARQDETLAKEREQAANEKLDQFLYLNQVQLAHREWLGNRVARAKQLLATCPPQRRHWEWGHVKRLCRAERLSCKGSRGSVLCVAFRPDGKSLASVSATDYEPLKVWDTTTGRQQLSFSDLTAQLASVAFSPDGKWLAAAGEDQQVRMWDAETGRLSRTLEGHKTPVNCLAFSPDGRLLASGGGKEGQAGEIKLWDTAVGRVVRSLQVEAGEVNCLAFSTDNRWVASAADNGTTQVWEAASGKQQTKVKGHEGAVLSVAFDREGKRVASGGVDRVVKVWDAATGREQAVFRGHADVVYSVAFRPDGKVLASGSMDRSVKLWDLSSGQESYFLRHADGVRCVAFSLDGRSLASASGDEIKFWGGASNPESLTLQGHVGPAYCVAFHPDGARLASAGPILEKAPERLVSGEVKVWDARTGQESMSLRGQSSLVTDVAFFPDGKFLASASEDGKVAIWDLSTSRIVRTLQGSGHFIYRVIVSPDGNSLVVADGEPPGMAGTQPGAGDKPGRVTVWHAPTGRKILAFEKHTGSVMGVAYTPDGRRVASICTRGVVRVWDTNTGEEVVALQDGGFDVAFSPDGKTLASYGKDSVALWDTKTWQAQKWTGAAGMGRLKFSSDGRRLLTVDGDDVKVWDAQTGQLALTFKAHSSGVTGIDFSHDGLRIATSGNDKAVRIWEATSWP